MTVERQVWRLRVIIAIMALVFALDAVRMGWGTVLVPWRRSVWLWWTGYRGCMCPDCVPEGISWAAWKVHVRPVWTGWTTFGYGHPGTIVLIVGSFSIVLMLFAVHGSGTLRAGVDWWNGLWETREDVCAHCGYSREGLEKGSLCPECGRRSDRS